MLEFARNLYRSQDLSGEFLLTPLKSYHGFFSEKIDDSEGMERVAWIVANVVSGIFAYPTLGAVAFIGMLIKLAGVPSLYSHNEQALRAVEGERGGIAAEQEHYVTAVNHAVVQAGYEMRVVREVRLTRENYNERLDAVATAIREQSRQLNKIYFRSAGAIGKDGGEIMIRLRILSPIAVHVEVIE